MWLLVPPGGPGLWWLHPAAVLCPSFGTFCEIPAITPMMTIPMQVNCGWFSRLQEPPTPGHHNFAFARQGCSFSQRKATSSFFMTGVEDGEGFQTALKIVPSDKEKLPY